MFDPTKHLVKVPGNREYLPVAPRIMWFRDTYPLDGPVHGHIETKVVACNEEWCAMHARVSLTDGEGTIVATGEGDAQEFRATFRDHVEKASTAAIGRALGALGFGTNDIDFAEGEIVDAPRGPVRMPAPAGAAPAPLGSTIDQPATPKQLGFLRAIAREKGMTDDDLGDEAWRLYERAVGNLTRGDASGLIDHLQARTATAAVDPRSEAANGMNEPASLYWSRKVGEATSVAAVEALLEDAAARFPQGLAESFLGAVGRKRDALRGGR